ncbi:MAG: hypothetical protein LUH47_08490 [Clostridiales bacterium]|nr:hypothetical protein [Clostridiales bacterium]
MIYNNAVTAEGVTSVFDTKELLRKIVTNSREMAEVAEKDDDGFIAADEIIQNPRFPVKDYFVREKDFGKIKEIYRIAASAAKQDITEEQYLSLFTYYPFKIKFIKYDASGYTLTKKGYAAFFTVYCDYVNAFFSKDDNKG